MERNIIKKAVIIGAGNVATHLAIALSQHIQILQIYSRRIATAQELCKHIAGATAINDIASIDPSADIYIISIKDDAIQEFVESVKIDKGLWVHTSGSISIEVFNGKMKQYGVLYPLQTFTRDVAVDIQNVPFFIEANDNNTLQAIKSLTYLLSPKVYEADSSIRCTLHTAAVFACNFTNFMWSQADVILHKCGLTFDIFEPLVKATLDKAVKISPKEGQTGPARRGDKNIITKHLESLDNEQAELYAILSEKIMKQYNSNI